MGPIFSHQKGSSAYSHAGLSLLLLLALHASLNYAAPAAIAPRDKIKVMIVGDSISQGREGDYTWRYRLWAWATTHGIDIEMVGPYTGTHGQAAPAFPSPPPLYGTTPAADPPVASGAAYAVDTGNFAANDNHWAYWGRQLAQDVDDVAQMVFTYMPDYLLVELGFNDMGWFVSDADGTLSSMEVFIAQARNSNPFLNFVIANVPQRTFIGGRDDLITKTDDYNAKLAAILPQWSIKDSPIYLADLRDWYDCEPDGCPAGSDGLHPNAIGEYQIARAFADTLHYAYMLGTDTLQIPPVDQIPIRPCDTPSNVQAVASYAGVTVTWDPVFGAYSYTVQSNFVGQDPPSTGSVNMPRTDTTWTVGGITWQYSIQALCCTVLSGWTDQVEATAHPTVAPGPSNIFVTPTEGGLSLNWDAVTGYGNDLSYGVLFYDTSIAGSYVSEYRFDGTSATLTDLPVGDLYLLGVQTWQPIDGVQYAGLPGGAGSVFAGEPELIPPTGFKVVTLDGGATIQATWDAVKYATDYRVWTRNTNNASSKLSPGTGSVTGTCFEATYLFPGAWYFEFCVTARNGNSETQLTGCQLAPKAITTVGACPAPPSPGIPPPPVTTPTVTWSSPSITTALPYPTDYCGWISSSAALPSGTGLRSAWDESGAGPAMDTIVDTYWNVAYGPHSPQPSKGIDEFVSSLIPSTFAGDSLKDCATPDSNGNCRLPETCPNTLDLVADFFMLVSFSNFNFYLTQMQTQVLVASVISSDNVGVLVKNIAIPILNDMAPPSSLLPMMLGILGLVSPLLGLTGEAAPYLGAIAGMFAGFAGLASLSDTTPVTDNFFDDTAATLQLRVAQVLEGMRNAIAALGQNVINNNDFSKMPTWALSGSHTYNNPITNFFQDGKFLEVTTDWTPVTTILSQYIMNNLVGLVLSSGDAYILVNAHPVDDCPAGGGTFSINKGPTYCYTIEGPGPGVQAGSWAEQEQYTVPLPNDSMNSVLSYGATLQEIIINAWQCQNSTNSYNAVGTLNLDTAPTSDYPQCFFNMPVFFLPYNQVQDTPSGQYWELSPCQLLNEGASSGRAGFDYLPQYLQNMFTDNFCQPNCFNDVCH